ncbi:MAG: hypothetical protein HYS87_02730 [Candidatus Colwellbacteria bacterium]|nr:hypothetical protein [Candidatus Colwellbacteria bacterium]
MANTTVINGYKIQYDANSTECMKTLRNLGASEFMQLFERVRVFGMAKNIELPDSHGRRHTFIYKGGAYEVRRA